MTSQSAIIEDTILAMKRVINKNKPDAFSDSDSEPAKPTNRNNKLKRKSQYFHNGQLGGVRKYRRTIEHAGYKRHILRRNPKRFDEEGYELFDDDTDEEADEEAAAKNPYNDIRIDNLLMPLTQASDLNDHPSLSLTYKSPILPTMVEEACDMVHKEKRTLADMKLLLARFRGDPTWMPLGAMLGEDDSVVFGTYPQLDGTFAAISLEPTAESLVRVEQTSYERHGSEKAPRIAVDGQSTAYIDSIVIPAEERHPTEPNGVQNGIIDTPKEVVSEPVDSMDAEQHATTKEEASVGPEADGKNQAVAKAMKEAQPLEGDAEMKTAAEDTITEEQAAPTTESEVISAPAEAVMADAPVPEASKSSNPPTPSAISSAGQSPPRMLTRGRANARATSSNNDPVSPKHNSTSHSPTSSELPIHPLFIPPPNAMPSRDFGLPSPEAEDSRRILSAWVQKQEEVCRGAERLYEGLLKAQRLRSTVWRWCRAEGHLGELSDGEDWVDMEEWGLDAPLKKGDQDGVGEEDTSKKTRGRRTAGG